MKNNKIGLFFGAAIIMGAYYIFSKRSFAKNANFSFEGLKFDWKKKKIEITLSCSNPTNNSITLNSVVGNLLVNNNTIASVESFVKTTIIANGKTIIKLDLIPSAIGILMSIKEFVTNKARTKQKINAKFIGSANMEGIIIPLDLQFLN
jgi:hypothetical protein